MWPFGTKITCFQCDKKGKERKSILRRGFRLCSPACVTAFLAANQFPAPRGDATAHRQELGNLLVSALGELERAGAPCATTGEIRTASGLTFRPGGGGMTAAIGAAMEQQRREEVTDAIHRFNAHITEALPYVSTLGMVPTFELLDTLDVDALIASARSGRHAPLQSLQQTLLGILNGL